MSLVEFELYRPIKADTARVETDKSGGRGLGGFCSDVCECLECLYVCMKLSLSHCAVDPYGRETAQSLSRPADLLLPIAQFYSLSNSFSGSV